MKPCPVCKDAIPLDRLQRKAKYCSEECSRVYWRERYRKQNPDRRLPVTSGTVGCIHELEVAVDLLRKGYGVYRALSQAAHCDLLVLTPEEKLLRVEVTTGTRGTSGKITHPPKDFGKFDVLAIVVGGEIVYLGLDIQQS